MENIAKFSPAVIACTGQIAEIFVTKVIPAHRWGYYAMLRSMAALAERFAIIVRIFPRHFSGGIVHMMYLQLFAMF